MDTTKKEQFERVSSIMLNTFPELRDSYNEVMEVSGGRIPGLHIILGDVLNPFIRQHLYVMTEQKILEKVFAFVEDLVTNEDEYILWLKTLELRKQKLKMIFSSWVDMSSKMTLLSFNITIVILTYQKDD